MRKTTIVVSSFLIGIASTVFAAATYDASIQTRATTMFNAIKSNASSMDPLDVSAYYTLVHLNITTLMQVLTTLDASVTAELAATSGMSDASVLDQITSAGISTNTNTQTATTTSNNTITLTLNQGALYCGNPDRNDYTSYSPVDKKVILQRDYCKSKGGKVWASCDANKTNVRALDTLKDGDNLSCAETVQNPGTTTTTTNNNGVVATQKVTIRVSAGTNISCGDPSRSDYLAWSDANWQTDRSTVVDKVYCNQKGGYVWATCDRVVTNKKSVDTLKEGDTFSCPVKQVNTTTTTTTSAGVTGATAAGNASNNTSTQSSSAVGTLEIIRTPAISAGLVVEGTSYLVTWKISGNIQKVSYTCKVNGVQVAGTTGLSSVERIQGNYTTKMIGTNYCEWIGHDAAGAPVTKTYEQFIVREKATTGTTTTTTTPPTEKISVTRNNGLLACGNPEKNDYLTYGVTGNTVILDKNYCTQKGGYVWIICDGKFTSTKSINNTKDGDVFACPVVSVIKDCVFNLKPYLDLGLKTTFYYGANNKMYQPSPTGQMTLPGDMRNQFNVTKAGSIDIEYGFQCQDGVLTVTDKNFSITTALPGVLTNVTTNSSSSNDPVVQKIDITCAGNGWPASVEVAVTGGYYNVFEIGQGGKFVNSLNLSNQKAQLSSNAEIIQVRRINSSEVISSVNVSSCRPNTYPARPEITTAEYNIANKSIVVKTKNALSDDNIEIFDGSASVGAFWQKDGNGTYTASLSDPYFQGLRAYIESGKSHVAIYGSFDPNFWRNSARYKTYAITVIGSSANTPVFNLVRNNLNDGQNVEWTTTNVRSLSYTCTTNGSTMRGDVELNRAKTFTSWISFHNAGWIAGKYTCIWNVVGANTTTQKTEDFVIL